VRATVQWRGRQARTNVERGLGRRVLLRVCVWKNQTTGSYALVPGTW